MNNSKRIYICVACIFIVLLTCIGLDMKFEKEFTATQLKLINGRAAINEQGVSVVRIDEAHGGAGIFTGGIFIHLEKGDYNVIIKYKTDTPKNYIELFSDIAPLDPKIVQGKDMHLAADANTKVIPISIDKKVFSLEVKSFYSGVGSLEIESIKIVQDGVVYYDKYIYVVLLCLLIAGAYLLSNNDKFVRWRNGLTRADINIYGCLCIGILVASYPLLNSYLILGHDMPFHINRIEGIKDALLAGQFPARIHPNYLGGYGYATGVMYPDLLLYIPALLRIIGLSMVASYQFYCFVINLLTAVIAYMSFTKITRSKYIGLTGAMLYLFAWYRLCNMYTRAAVGEVTAMAFLPLFLLGCYYIIYGDYRKWLYAAIGYTFILQSHILSAFLVSILAVGLICVSIKNFSDKLRVFAALKTVGLVTVLNLWFLVPFASFYKLELNVRIPTVYLNDCALTATQLFNFFSIPIYTGLTFYDVILSFTLSLKLGGALVIGCLIFVFIGWRYRRKRSIQIGWWAFGIGALFAYCSTNLFPWAMIENTAIVRKTILIIQFPWRLLGFADVFLSLAAAVGIVTVVRYFKHKTIILGLVYLCFYLSSASLLDQYTLEECYLTKESKIESFGPSISGGEYLYKGTDVGQLQRRGAIVEASNPTTAIDNFTKNGTNLSLDYTIQNRGENEFIEVPLLYYPGYRAYTSDGEAVAVQKGNNNIVRLILPQANTAHIELSYEGKKSFVFAEIVSGIAVVLLIGYGIRRYVHKGTLS